VVKGEQERQKKALILKDLALWDEYALLIQKATVQQVLSIGFILNQHCQLKMEITECMHGIQHKEEMDCK
jgi:hypothetical protein